MTIRQQDVVCAFVLPQKSKDKAEESLNGEGKFKLLCAQRLKDAEYFPSLYEFIGGKVDAGETHHEALIREVKEELDVNVELIQENAAYSFNHPQKLDKKRGDQVIFRCFFYWTRLIPNIDGSAAMPKALASQKIEWLTPQEMAERSFCTGDADIIMALNEGTLRPAS